MWLITMAIGGVLLFMNNTLAGVVVIGHRGVSKYAPEKTLASFEKAIELGVHIV